MLGGGIENWFAYVLALVFLLFRPEGLFGERHIDRVLRRVIYRETGQFKTTYASDQQLFPILQDRVFVIGFLVFAFGVMPFIGTEYLFRAILVPFLILSLAAIGLNILVGYCGQVSLGTGAFMAIGAYAAYNLAVRVPGPEPASWSSCWPGVFSTIVGVLFGIPSLRIKGFYLAVATLAAQFFVDWLFARVKWFTNDSSSGNVSAPPLEIFGYGIDTPGADATSSCWRSSACSRWSRATSCAARSAARGWPRATWTSPPR